MMGIHCECYTGDEFKGEDEIVSWCLYHATMRDELTTAQARVRELEAVLEAIDAWDLDWADGLDANIERIKTMVRAALKP